MKKKWFAMGVFTTLLGLAASGLAFSRCESCKERMRAFMAHQMSDRMPHMMKACLNSMPDEERVETIGECQTVLAELGTESISK